MAKRFTAVPRIYGSSAPSELGETNNFLQMVLDPMNAPMVPMPDDTPKVAVLKSTVLYGNLSGQTGYVFLYQPQNKVASLVRGRRVTHPAIAGQSVIGWDAIELYDQDLSQNYSRGRPIASALEISSTTISSGVFTLNGLMNASSFTGNIQWERMDPNAMTSYDTPTAKFGVSVYDGLHATWIPDTDDLAPIPVASQSISPVVSGNPVASYDGGFQYYFRTAGLMGTFGFKASGTVLNVNGAPLWESHPAAAWNPETTPAILPTDLPGRIKLRTSFVVTILDADYAAATVPTFEIRADYVNGAGIYVNGANSGSAALMPEYGPKQAGRTALRVVMELDVDANIPIDRWYVCWTGGAVAQLGNTASPTSISQIDVQAPDALSDHNQNHRIVMSIENIDAAANVTFKGVTNWEVVPNFTLAQEVNPDYRLLDTPEDLYAALALMGSGQFRPLTTIKEFADEHKHYSRITVRDNLRVMNASFFSGLGRALKGGFNFLTKTALPAALKVADHPLTREIATAFSSSETKRAGKQVWSCSGKPKVYRCGNVPKILTLAATYCAGCETWLERTEKLYRSVCEQCSGTCARQFHLYPSGSFKFERPRFRAFNQFTRLNFKVAGRKIAGCIAEYEGQEVIALSSIAPNYLPLASGIFVVSTKPNGDMLLAEAAVATIQELAQMNPMPRFTLTKLNGKTVAAVTHPPEAQHVPLPTQLFAENKQLEPPPLERQTNATQALSPAEPGAQAMDFSTEPVGRPEVWACSSRDDDNPFAEDDEEDEQDDDIFNDPQTHKMPVATARAQAKDFAKGSTLSEWLAGNVRPTVVKAQIFPIVSPQGDVKFCTVYASPTPIVGEKYTGNDGVYVNLDRFLPAEQANVMRVIDVAQSTANLPMKDGKLYITFHPPAGVILNQGSYGLALTAALYGLPNIGVLSGVYDEARSVALRQVVFTAPGDMGLKTNAAFEKKQSIIFGASQDEPEVDVVPYSAYFNTALPLAPQAYSVTSLSDLVILCLARARRKTTSGVQKFTLAADADRAGVLEKLEEMRRELVESKKSTDHITGLLDKQRQLKTSELKTKASKILAAYQPKTKGAKEKVISTPLTPEQVEIVRQVANLDTDGMKDSDAGEIQKAQRIIGAWKNMMIGRDADQTRDYVNHLKSKYLSVSKKKEKAKKSQRTFDEVEDDDIFG